LGHSSTMRQLIRRLFPRASKYDKRWVLENSLGENVLYNTEALAKSLELKPGMRVLDLGCGKAASSIFLAREYGVQVWAVDNTLPEQENARRIRCAFVEDRVTPVQADAEHLPFEKDFFDLVIAVDSYMYYGTKKRYLPYVLQFVKPNGRIAVLDACFRREVRDAAKLPGYLRTKIRTLFRKMHSVRWWKELWRSSGKVKLLEASVLKESDVILEEYVRDFEGRKEEQELVKIVKQDQGRFIGIFKLIARKLRTSG
jgi:cyclopropane fatty-acyl-phospholipid synthase-like methyltransferase